MPLPFVRRIIKRNLRQSRTGQTNVNPIPSPGVWLRLIAVRRAQVSFVEFEVPNKP